MRGGTNSLPVRSRLAAFTLVELLVVIGIIALLISILLPALSNARRQADQTKCGAQMRQLYNGFLLYAADHKNVWPAQRVNLGSTFVAGTKVYSVGDVDFPVTDTTITANAQKSIYYYDFIAKYLTKTKAGVSSTTADEAQQATRSIVWACPAWEPFAGTQTGGINRVSTGIAMNTYPTYTGTYPAAGTNFPPAAESNWIQNLGDSTQVGQWYSGTKWGRQGAARALLTDGNLYLAEAKAMPTTGGFPPQPGITNAFTYTPTVAGQTTVAVYRHGKNPGPNGTYPFTFAATGGKVAFNVLYADGHVAGATDQKVAYETLRQRFPG